VELDPVLRLRALHLDRPAGQHDDAGDGGPRRLRRNCEVGLEHGAGRPGGTLPDPAPDGRAPPPEPVERSPRKAGPRGSARRGPPARRPHVDQGGPNHPCQGPPAKARRRCGASSEGGREIAANRVQVRSGG
jgi:hypothetical protein